MLGLKLNQLVKGATGDDEYSVEHMLMTHAGLT